MIPCIENERILVISNNVLSTTNNNGKTLLSYFDGIPKDNLRQLYFSQEVPMVEGYDYFRISDKDVLKSKLFFKPAGSTIEPVNLKGNQKSVNGLKKVFGKNTLTCLLREFLWFGSWKSRKLIQWLDDFQPTVVFFLAGDSLFAYDVYEYVVKRFKCNSAMYITDDYILDRDYENPIGKLRRGFIERKIKRALSVSHHFFTVSSVMRSEYFRLFSRDSMTIVNMSQELYRPQEDCNIEKDVITIVYAGSLYYGRDKVIIDVSKAVREYNEKNVRKKIFLKVYTNDVDRLNGMIDVEGCSKCYSAIDFEYLVKEYNRADILLFVESFEKKYIEKTRCSLSTKVTEYLSLKKPILAIGPAGIGSMEYLRDVSVSVTDVNEIGKSLDNMGNSAELRSSLAESAYRKYKVHHSKDRVQKVFLSELVKR